MDPITALSLASGILTFIDFAGKIVAGTYEIYRSTASTTEENAHIGDIAADLTEITSKLATTAPARTSHDVALHDLASKCNAISIELQNLITTLQVSGTHTTWKSLKMRSKACVRSQRSSVVEASNVKSKLSQLEDTMSNISGETATRLSLLREDMLKNVKRLLDDSSTTFISATGMVKDELWELRQSLEPMALKMKTLPRENAILQNIFFSAINLREESIRDPETGTFGWIFEDDEDDWTDDEHDGAAEGQQHAEQTVLQTDQERKAMESLERKVQAREIFLSWLKSGGGVFHISGKAGSGKSTLMKFLCHHERTNEELQTWVTSKKKTLVFASFYFWNSGDNIQMSLEGLLRSVLFETLKRCPELIPAVFPEHWNGLENDMFYVPGDLFKNADITKAFDNLAADGTFPNHRFCFFIDGLDEYKGESQDYLELVKTLQRWASSEDVKICASSRPYIEFDNLGLENRKFHLHQYTAYDIYLFSRQMIEKDDNFDYIKDSYLGLVDRVVEMSEGVFLWARLVVSSLLAGMLRHDTIKSLEEKLEVTPRGIDELYDSILDSLDAHDRKRAVQMLFATAYYPFAKDKDFGVPLNCLTYGWLDELDNPDFPPVDGRKPTSWRPASTMVKDVQRQLKSLAKGLLDTAAAPLTELMREYWESQAPGPLMVVQFSHRTVKDFVIRRLGPNEGGSQHPSLLEAESYYRLILADLTLGTPEYRRAYWNIFMLSAVPYNRSLFYHALSSRLLDGFSRVLSSEHNNSHVHAMGVHGGHGYFFEGADDKPMSFIRMIAYAGQKDYVLREISAKPDPCQGEYHLHVLLSAASGGHRDLVSGLIANGLSLTDMIQPFTLGSDSKASEDPSLPVWLVFLAYNIYYDELTDNLDVLEVILNESWVDVTPCMFCSMSKKG
ncbi:hypothetical protein V8F33_011609 [Rhypophila sp. PSN 637]